MNFFSDSSSLYLYSALLQANAAIIALIGVFFIYKFQALQNDIDSIRSFMLKEDGMRGQYIRYHLFYKLNLYLKKKKLIEQKSDLFFDNYNEWFIKELQVAQLKLKLKSPILFLAYVLISNAILLFFSTYLHNNFIVIEIIVGFLSVVAESILIIKISKLIYSIILDKIFYYDESLEELKRYN